MPEQRCCDSAVRFELRSGELSAADCEQRSARRLQPATWHMPANRDLLCGLHCEQYLRPDAMRISASRHWRSGTFPHHQLSEQCHVRDLLAELHAVELSIAECCERHTRRLQSAADFLFPDWFHHGDVSRDECVRLEHLHVRGRSQADSVPADRLPKQQGSDDL